MATEKRMFWGIMSVIFGAAGATLLFTGADLWGRDEFLLLAIEFIVMGSVILATGIAFAIKAGRW
jgi:hypothetical protein